MLPFPSTVQDDTATPPWPQLHIDVVDRSRLSTGRRRPLLRVAVYAGWYSIGYHVDMTAAQIITEVRHRSGLGLRELARRAGTSHATLHAYEAGAKEPRLDTVARVADAAGFTLEVTLARRPDAGAARVAKGDELAEVLALAAEFPVRHRRRLTAPIFGPVAV